MIFVVVITINIHTISVYTYTDTYVCVYVCRYVCVCIYIYIYIHTNLHKCHSPDFLGLRKIKSGSGFSKTWHVSKPCSALLNERF